MRTSFAFLLTAAVFMPANSPTLAQPSGTGGFEPPQWVAASSELPKAEVTLDQAITRALQLNSSLAAGTYAVSAAEARVIQAGLLPNPALELEAERALLAATWCSSTVAFDQAVGELPEPKSPPTLGQLRLLLMDAPEITRLARISHQLSSRGRKTVVRCGVCDLRAAESYLTVRRAARRKQTPQIAADLRPQQEVGEICGLEDQIERQRNVLELEKLLRIPDLTVSIGPRRFEVTGQSAWVAGLSLPIPIFDRNQGSRRTAEFEVEGARLDAEAVRVALETELAAALERLHAAAQEATTMGREIVPGANVAFAATETGYSEGQFGFLDVLDAQRALFEARSLLVDSREEYAATLTVLERLIGRPTVPQTGAAPGGHDSSQGEK